MPLFKNNKHTEILNKINNLENKINTLHNNFTDRQCNCSHLENTIYTDLHEKFNSTLLDNSNDLELRLKIFIEDVYNTNKDKLLETLQIYYKTHTHNTKLELLDLFNILTQNLSGLLIQFQNDIQSTHTEKDISLRTDLQTLLLGMQKELSTNISSQTSTYINHVLDINNQLTKHIKDLETLSTNIDKNVSGFYYENEIVKHQLQLSEDIRKYSDEIQTLRLLANNAKTSIDNLLDEFELSC